MQKPYANGKYTSILLAPLSQIAKRFGGEGGWGSDASKPGVGNPYGGSGEQDDGSNGGRGGDGGDGVRALLRDPAKDLFR